MTSAHAHYIRTNIDALMIKNTTKKWMLTLKKANIQKEKCYNVKDSATTVSVLVGKSRQFIIVIIFN